MIVDLSRAELLRLLDGAPRGKRFLYHIGFLYNDRVNNRKLNLLAHAIYETYLDGTCCLVQRRLGPFQYEYYAVKR